MQQLENPQSPLDALKINPDHYDATDVAKITNNQDSIKEKTQIMSLFKRISEQIWDNFDTQNEQGEFIIDEANMSKIKQNLAKIMPGYNASMPLSKGFSPELKDDTGNIVQKREKCFSYTSNDGKGGYITITGEMGFFNEIHWKYASPKKANDFRRKFPDLKATDQEIEDAAYSVYWEKKNNFNNLDEAWKNPKFSELIKLEISKNRIRTTI